MIALDSNLLVYAFRSWYAEHKAARRAIEQAAGAGRGFGFPLQCISEFWSVVTQPLSGGPAAPGEAHAFLNALVLEAGARVWLPSAGFWERLLRTAVDLRVRGGRIYDLQIALIAFDNGASEIWTHDRNFVRMPGLRVHDPL
jgi:predicted nucleic acid-binding protein